MKRLFYTFIFAITSVLSFSQVVSFDLSDTALSAEEVKAKTGKAVKLIYPTSMKSKIPAMECNVQVDGLGPFSVAEGKQVMFAPVNLQFNAALGTHQCADGTTQKGTWRFAEHQWDYVGDASNGNVYHNGTKCDNTKISETYDGWIDLFGWGTSGWNSGAVAYQPWSTSTSDSDYYPGGNENNDFMAEYAYADWGVYNQIGSDASNAWRTLTSDEWLYIFRDRAGAEELFGLGSVNGVNGVIILPDVWKTPDGLNFVASTSKGLMWMNNYYTIPGVDCFSHNTYTSEQWKQMETHGAVFLPAAGRRNGTYILNAGSYGYLWSASKYDAVYSKTIYFYAGYLNPQNNYYRDNGHSVRLVADL